MRGVQVVWFKRDLRVRDHRPLVAAAHAGPVLCLYVHEPSLLHADDADARHVAFATDALRALDVALRERGGALVVRTGEMPALLDVLDAELAALPVPSRIAAVHAHEETTNAIAYARDRAVRAWCRSRGIPCHEVPQTGVVRRLPTRDGWADRWDARMHEPVTPAPARLDGVILDAVTAFPTPRELGVAAAHPSPVLQVGGEEVARADLRSFLRERGVGYRREMSSPVTAFDGCSRISAHLAVGALSIRTAEQSAMARLAQLAAMREAGEPVDPRWAGSITSFRARIRWHCHFMQKMEDEPAIEWASVCPAYEGLRDRVHPDPERLAAYVAGRTGYPLVDACLRCAAATGWLPFRMRAMVMAFAAYHLWLDWRPAGLVLARWWLDYEPGIHWPQCQMQSGVTGINAIRIYNPIKQSYDQDPDGRFIRAWIPELAAVPLDYLHEPHRMPPLVQQMCGVVVGRDYPAPIVDNVTAMRAARDRIWAVRRAPGTRDAAHAVYVRHGSRAEPFARRPIT